VIIADLHKDGCYVYPGTGMAQETAKRAAAGTRLNIPLPAGTLLLQRDADSVDGDPRGDLAPSSACHGQAARELAPLAPCLDSGRVLALGGAGYNLHNLALAWTAVIEGLLVN
jgi:acetoin utilization protein AcuC